MFATVFGPQRDYLFPSSGAQPLHLLADLPVRVMAVLIEKRRRQLDFERLILQQIDCLAGRDLDIAHHLDGRMTKLLARRNLILALLGIFDQCGCHANVF